LTLAPAPNSISILPVLLVNENKRSFIVPFEVQEDGRNADIQFNMNALIDSGADVTFIDKKFVLEWKIALAPLDKNIMPLNIDGTKNKSGIIRHCTWLKNQKTKCPHQIPCHWPQKGGNNPRTTMVERTQSQNWLAARNHVHWNNLTSNYLWKSDEKNHGTVMNVHSFPKTNPQRNLWQLWTPLHIRLLGQLG